ncbi:translation initiation factor IF-2 [Sorangium cellulosum]|uniref:Translation initiation factor IF-2 n=2 Tax=Sorangium cellulosum TaxID=56 RepID=A0A2L0F504_SORCE|nr:translation initiation factor IF-2 [Sorangium cellulosum]
MPRRTGIEVWSGRPGVPRPEAPRSWQRAPSQPAPARGAQQPPARGAQHAPAPGARPATSRPADGPSSRRDPRFNAPGRPGAPRRAPEAPRQPAAPSTQEMSARKKVVKIEEQVSLHTLAARMGVKATDVLLKLLALGVTGVHVNSVIDADAAKLVASDFGWDVEDVAVTEEQILEHARGPEEDEAGPLSPRSPIVTVMGHVDHGKTSLLDRIRQSKVAAGEAGGITQHVGAYRVKTSKGTITFLDTPGHEAFTEMRARGASLTDIIVLVVAADEGERPQTREAIRHAQSAKVPVVVAVNKVDKPGADPERIRRELGPLGLAPEAWGGDTLYCDVSAKTGEGIEDLLEMISLQAEMLRLQANPKRPATGTVVEALLDRGKGPLARVLVTDGTLRTGDVVIAGAAWGRVRAMTDELGRRVAEAGPSTPVEILGLSDVPKAGDTLYAARDQKKAQALAEARRTKAGKVQASTPLSLAGLAGRLAAAGQMELRLILKADVQGSVEALSSALARLSTDKVRVNITHAGVGAVTEGDVNLASAAKAIVVGFNVRPTGKAASLAEAEGVEIRSYDVIYAAIDDVMKAMAGLLAPVVVEKPLGAAEVRELFKVGKLGTIAGCMVTTGSVKRSGKVRLVRDGAKVWEGKIAGLRRVKEDVSSVERLTECGILLDGYSALKPGDVIECYEMQEVAATL